MTKFSIEPNRLKSFLSQVFAYKGSAITDQSIIDFTPNGVSVACLLNSTTLVYAKYNKTFFQDYESENKPFMVNETLIKEISYGYSGEKVYITITENEIQIKGDSKDDTVKIKIDAVNDEKRSPNSASTSDIGLLPNKINTDEPFTTICQIKTTVEALTKKISTENLNLTYENEVLKITLSDEIKSRERPLPVLQTTDKKQPFNLKFNTDAFQSLISQFTGEIWISINDLGIVFSQKNNDYSLSYALASIMED